MFSSIFYFYQHLKPWVGFWLSTYLLGDEYSNLDILIKSVERLLFYFISLKIATKINFKIKIFKEYSFKF